MTMSGAHSLGGSKRPSRSLCLMSTSLCSAALAGVLMSMSVALAAPLNPTFTTLGQTVTQTVGGPFDSITVNMLSGNETFRLDANVRTAADMTVNGRLGDDTFQILDTRQLDVTGSSVFQNTENLINLGTFNTGDLIYTGTGGIDTIDNRGTIDVTGTATFNMGGGDDAFNNRTRSRLSATGNIVLDGQTGSDILRNDGRIESTGPGSDLSITGFETVNNGGVLRANDDLTYTGTAGIDRFTNSGLVRAGGDLSFGFGGGNDVFVNRGTAEALAGTATFDGGVGTDDELFNADTGSIAASGVVDIKNFETVTNNGTITAGGALNYTGSDDIDTFTNGPDGSINVTGSGIFDSGDGTDSFLNNGSIDIGNNATFNGGDGDGDTFTNNAGGGNLISVGGQTIIKNYETVINNGRFDANGGFGYAGSNTAGSFTNTAGGAINVNNGDATFNGLGGRDVFTNDGSLAVTGGNLRVENIESVRNTNIIRSTGTATFDGGAAGENFGNSGTLQASGLMTIRNFVTVTNADGGIINAEDGLTYGGTSGADTFGNGGTGTINVRGGDGLFDGLGGVDTFTNAGTLKVTGPGNGLTVQNIETVTNSGTLVSVGDAAFNGGAAGAGFTNSGGMTVLSSLTVSNFTTLSNTGSGTITVSGGDATFSGRAAADTFTNAGQIDVTGAGNDLAILNIETVTNQNRLTSGAAVTFDGGPAGVRFDNSDEITAGTVLTIGNFTATANSGTITAGALNYAGTATANTFDNVAGGNINVAGGDASFDGLAGSDTFTNAGTVAVTGAGNLNTVNFERVNNQGTLSSQAAATFDGGTNGIRFGNSGTVSSGALLTISNFVTTANSRIITAGAGLAYTGTGGADAFSNEAAGVITITGNGTFDLGAGNDDFVNRGGLTASLAATFDGGGGTADTFTNAGGATIGIGGLASFSGFRTLTNAGGITAGGGLSATGTAGIDTFNNTAAGSVTVTGGLTSFTSVERVINGGTLTAGAGLTQTGATSDRFVNSGTVNLTGNGILSGDLSNSGLFDMNPGGAGNTVGQTLSVGGNFAAAAGTVEIDINLGGAGGQGVTDSITVAGNSTGTLNLTLIDRNAGANLLYATPLSIVSSGGGNLAVNVGGDFNNMALANGGTALLDEFGFINYNITNNNGDVSVNTQLDTDEAGGVAGGLSSTLSAISAIFHKPSSAFLSSCKQGNDGRGFGSWARAAGGSLDTDISGTSDFGDLSSKNTTDFTGLQGGFDTQFCDVGSGKAVIHAGLTVGNIKGNSTQTNGDLGFDVDFNSYFAGAYGAFIQGPFSADVLLRYDDHHFDLSHDDGDIITPGTETDGSTLSAMAASSYRISLSDTLLFTPSAGVTVSRTSVDSFGVNNGSTIRFDDLISIMGYAGANIQKTFQVTDTAYLLPFVSLNVYNEFGDGGSGVLDIGGLPVNFDTDSVGTFGQLGAGVNFFVLGGEPATEPNIVGGARFDTQFGESLQGWALTGNVRLQF